MSHCCKRRTAKGGSTFWRYFLEGISLPDLYAYRPLRRGSRVSNAGLVTDMEAVGRDFRTAIKLEVGEATPLPEAGLSNLTLRSVRRES